MHELGATQVPTMSDGDGSERDDRLAPPPGPGARFDVFERETLRSLNKSLRGLLTLGTEGNRNLGELSKVLHVMNETQIANRDLTQILIVENQLTREAIRTLADEIAMLRADRKAERAADAERERDAARKPAATKEPKDRPRALRKVAAIGGGG